MNPYVHRTNGGIPIFSQERIKNRAKKVNTFSLLYLTRTADKFGCLKNNFKQFYFDLIWSKGIVSQCHQLTCFIDVVKAARLPKRVRNNFS